MKLRKSLSFKLAVFILGGTSLVFLGAFSYNYRTSRALTLAHIKTDMDWMARDSVKRINANLSGVEVVPEYAALRIGRGTITEKELWDMLEDAVSAHPMIYGSTASFEPFGFSKKRKAFAPYVCEQGNELKRSFLDPPAYDYFTWPWYYQPRQENKSVWSEPYFDEGGGNIPMCTYSVPFYSGLGPDRKFAGVITADISLNWLIELVSSIKVSSSGYGFLVSRKGLVIAHPDKSLVMRGTLAGFAERTNNRELLKVAQKINAGEEGFVRVHMENDYWHVFFLPLPKSGWTLGIMAPEKELFADLASLWRNVLIIGICGFGLLFIVAALLSSSFVRPIRLLAGSTAQIAKGNLDAQLPPIK
ncbi:MAG TPA: cache domain-containing protein, partial [Elusimicrobiales bacterium]|nr:cache domain-containing protein [Elusimicrobiales bacterium]